MSLSHLGLCFDIIAASLLGFESWIKLRTIQENSIVIGYGKIGVFWRWIFFLSWPLLVLGFILQYIGSK